MRTRCPDVRATLDELGAELDRDPAGLELSVARGFVPPGREEEGLIPDRRNLGALGRGDRRGAGLVRRRRASSLVLIQVGILAPLMPEALEWFAAEVVPQLD